MKKNYLENGSLICYGVRPFELKLTVIFLILLILLILLKSMSSLDKVLC